MNKPQARVESLAAPTVEQATRPTRLIVYRGVIEQNARIIGAHLSSGVRMMAVVKANGYGHGAVQSALAALAGGATCLGVATVAEARELRDAGITESILVLGSSAPEEALDAAALGISVGVGDLDQARLLFEILDKTRSATALRVHLKIDTGMRRFGVTPQEAPGLAWELASRPGLELEGVYSHFAESDAESECRMDEQIATFRSALAAIDELGISRGFAHISNSGALLRNRSADFDLVRAGICLYGISPSEHVPLFEGMTAALEWRATVQHTADMRPGDRTGYGGTYVASEHERLALLPVGYADGYPRSLSNRGWVGFQGMRLPVRGRVSMDQCAVGIVNGLQPRVGDEVTILGPVESGAPDANQLGELAGTIGYEIVSRISRRVPVEYR